MEMNSGEVEVEVEVAYSTSVVMNCTEVTLKLNPVGIQIDLLVK